MSRVHYTTKRHSEEVPFSQKLDEALGRILSYYKTLILIVTVLAILPLIILSLYLIITAHYLGALFVMLSTLVIGIINYFIEV